MVQQGIHVVDEGKHFVQELAGPAVSTVQSAVYAGQNALKDTRRFLMGSAWQAVLARRALSSEDYDRISFHGDSQTQRNAGRGTSFSAKQLAVVALAPAGLVYHLASKGAGLWNRGSSKQQQQQRVRRIQQDALVALYACRDRHIARVHKAEQDFVSKLKHITDSQNSEQRLTERVLSLATPDLTRDLRDQLHSISNQGREELMGIVSRALQHMQRHAPAELYPSTHSLHDAAMTCLGALSGVAVEVASSTNTSLLAAVAGTVADGVAAA